MYDGKIRFAQVMDFLIKKRLKLDASLYTLLQILSVTIFEKTRIQQALLRNDDHSKKTTPCKKLNLFTSLTGQ